MKFKVTRNEPLEKAMNKANLVLVEVPVNTKKGQHRSHRWKRAIDALDQLFEDLGKKANSEDIAFIDKNTNKKVNKDELIKDYKKRGKKENKTLQTFVAENYKVSTRKDNKEVKTVNPKNINTLSSKNFADYVYKNGSIEGTEDGLYIKLNGKDIEVKFDNDDINDYLGTDLEGEELLEVYEEREDKIDKHFIEEQREEILEQLSDEEEDEEDEPVEEVEASAEDEFADYIYNNADIEGTEDGLFIKIDGKEATVNFGNDDINEYLGTDLEGEDLLNAYEEREEEIDKHFIKEQKEEIEEQLGEGKKPKEKIITMASRSKYKQEHFYGTFKCGHEGDLYTGGYSEEYRKQAAEDKFDHELCPHCEQKRIEEERERERAKAREVAEEMGLPELEGSEKQIKWALSIRNEVIEDLKPSIDYAKKLLEDNPSNNIAKAYVKMGEDFINITDSAKWIDYRKLDFKKIMANIISGYNWNGVSWYGTFLSDERRLDKDFLFDYESLPTFENERAKGNRRALCEAINDLINIYLKNILKEDAKSDYSNLLMNYIGKYKDIVENNDDELFYESLEQYDLPIFYETTQYRGKLVGEEDHDSMLKAYKKRNELIRDFVKEKKNGNLTSLEVEMLDNFLKNCVATSGYSENYAEDNVKEFAQKLTRTYKKFINKQRINELAANGALKRLGTKKIESKGEYKKTSNFEDLRTNLEKLKGLHTDTVARAAMDMAGINAPLYVRRNDGIIKLSSTSKCVGYCQYDYNGTVKEIAVVDFTGDRAHSYKTTIHEVMHGLLAQTKSKDGASLAPRMNKVFNEGIVEMIGTASMKKAYGKEYRSQERRAYADYVVDTCLRLKKMNEFKGKTFSQIADTLGNAAFNRDWDNLSRINDYLERSYKESPGKCSLNEGYNDLDKIEKSAKKRFADENNGDMTNFEKTQIAMLVDRLKNTDFTLEQALNSDQYGELAAILLYNMLEDEDDELLGLL